MEDFPFREWLGRMVVRVGGAVIFGWMNRVFPIQAVWQPMGTVSVRSRSSGADTEVRPPATPLSDPFGATCGWGPFGRFRFRVFGCPIGRVPADQHPAERTRRSASPPPVIWAQRMVSLCGMPFGVFDPRFWAAHSFGLHPTKAQRSGHGGPPCRAADSGPSWRDVWRERTRFPDSNGCAAHRDGSSPIQTKRSRHGGLRYRCGSYRTFRCGVWMGGEPGLTVRCRRAFPACAAGGG